MLSINHLLDGFFNSSLFNRYWMDRGNFEQALRYMNLLRGGAKAVAKDWMQEVIILLETQQASNALLSHASASGLVYS